MEPQRTEENLSGLLESLAAIEHERWSHWQRYVHSMCLRQSDGSLVIPVELVSRWERQMSQPYSALSDEEKESDRERVRKYLPAIESVIQRRP
jgi:hypothetical protein